MKNLTARFTGHGSKLTVTARTGKKGLEVLVRTRTPEGKSSIGCRNVFLLTHEADALAKFEELSAAALAKGWTEKAKVLRGVDAFVTVPSPAEVEKLAVAKLVTAAKGKGKTA